MRMARRNHRDYNCAVEASIDVIGGKWKPLVLWAIKDGALRFSRIAAELPGITQRMLTRQLRELEEDGIVHREVYAQVPPRVEYSLTESGRTIVPILEALYAWGEANLGDYIRPCTGNPEPAHSRMPCSRVRTSR